MDPAGKKEKPAGFCGVYVDFNEPRIVSGSRVFLWKNPLWKNPETNKLIKP
ncbi:hypothetical protein [Methanosarcina acetivorans]|uniref:hypothetical protein n=1 Tax=Methanosarcina acetivorans TaxID=2214 RepID=UPI000A6F2D2B|nr:hypothetical protein [Methanosarcina acetivorans]